MRKIAGVGFCLIAVGIGWYLFSGTAQETPVQQNKPAPVQSMKVESTDKPEPDTTMSNGEDIPQSDEAAVMTSAEEREACRENYQKMPEWKEIENILSAIYMNGEEAAGQGTFQQMPIESLKSFADAGDKDAMFHYGSALMWKAGIGVYLYYQGKVEGMVDPKGYRKKAKNHKPDLELFNQGVEYSYKAAVQGRYGGVMEIGYMSQMMLTKMAKHDYPESQQIDVLAGSIAHLKLLQFIHQKDKALTGFINHDSYTKKLFERIFGDRGNNKDIQEKVDTLADKKYQRLKRRWSADRAYYGFEETPDLITPRLEQFYEEQVEECDPESQE